MDVVHFIKSQHGWHFDDKVKMMVSILPKDTKYSKKKSLDFNIKIFVYVLRMKDVPLIQLMEAKNT